MLNVYNQASINEPLDSTARENESLEILDYGTNNAFPASLLDNVEYSHVTNRCIDVNYKFIVGDGFVDPALNDIIINSDGQTLQEFHQSCAMDMAYFDGIYSNIKYNSNLQSTEYFHLPFENSRLGMYNEIGKITNIKYNPQWGQRSGVDDTETIVTYPVFNNSIEVLGGQIQELGAQYRGQVLYSHVQRPQKRFYPVPQYYSAENWIKIDSKIGNFHVNNIDNNFLLSVLLKVVGDPDEAATKLEKDEDGRVKSVTTKKKKGQVFKEEMSKNFSGSENGGKVMVLWAKAKEQFPELEEFPANTNHDLFVALQNLVVDNILIATGVPRVLANVETSGSLGDSNQVAALVKYMQGNVQAQQALLEDHYKKLFSNASNPLLKGITPKIKKFSYDFTDIVTGLQEQG